MDAEIANRLTPKPPPPDPGGEARLLSAQHRIKEHEDQMLLEFEKFKRQDVELLIKAKQSAGGSGQAPQRTSEEVNININSGNKRVKIRRTDDGLIGETEEI